MNSFDRKIQCSERVEVTSSQGAFSGSYTGIHLGCQRTCMLAKECLNVKIGVKSEQKIGGDSKDIK